MELAGGPRAGFDATGGGVGSARLNSAEPLDCTAFLFSVALQWYNSYRAIAWKAPCKRGVAMNLRVVSCFTLLTVCAGFVSTPVIHTHERERGEGRTQQVQHDVR